ncbi:hypothetical protein EX895_004130 [Sporisorium graminicola]|uniref:AAA+ ATPase domain-containing protein n=1 Tax=Sporisorium graminicola TaxID=280036 RepID=A0A4U7KR89_9BASI|nr:hypothetical protein EX895_004130 [Sporisorium graminicola]TKY86843.1 hypothetical protein EX895_004130 [Sporisorium graminicola]
MGGEKAGAPAADGRISAFSAFHQLGSGVFINTEVTLQTALKEIHRPDHVTWIDARECDILGFAEAGHAKARLRESDATFTAIRSYKVAARYLDEPQGSVRDTIWFAQWDYEWNGQSVLCYKFRWIADHWAHQYYVVVTDQSNVVDGRCKYTEQLIKACGTWCDAIHDEIYVYEDGEWEKNKALFHAVSKASWDDVILSPSMKTEIVQDVESFFDSRSTYAEYNIPWKRGIILHGPPGCGKTISIKALMNSVRHKNVANLYVKSFRAGCHTDERSIREIFMKARAVSPALLVFEDLDSLVQDDVRSFFLNEVDGLEDNDGIFIIGSTNHIERLDTSITQRPSRFDRKFHFEPPSKQERLLYCQFWQQKLQTIPAIEITDEVCQAVADSTEGLTFAYLKEVFLQSLTMHLHAHAHSKGQGTSETEGLGSTQPKIPSSLESNSFYKMLQQNIKTVTEDLGSQEEVPINKIPRGTSDSPKMKVVRARRIYRTPG